MELTSSNTASDLFEYDHAFLPFLTDGETLFSWGARYHRLSGNVLAKVSSTQLFGDGRAGLRHDFPSHIDRLVKITKGQIGDAESLACQRSLFGFFAPFLEIESASNLLRMLCGNSVSKVKSALGLLPSRLGGHFPLKACAECMKESLRKHSVTRWQIEHQWPSVWICRTHGGQLLVLKRSAQPKDMRRWLLPEDVIKEEWEEKVSGFTAIRDRLHWIAELSAHFAKLNGKYFDHLLLRFTYILRAKERGLVSTDGSLRLADCRTLFLEYYSGMDMLPGFEVVRSAQGEQGGLLGLLMRKFPWRRHPMKHILLIAFLFDTIARFEETYERAYQTQVDGGIDALAIMVGESWKNELKRLVEVEGVSLSGAAQTIGISLSVAIRVAKQEGLIYKRKTRVLNTELGVEILKMIATGLTREEILQKSGIKRTLLKDLMAREPTLRDAWKKRDFERRKDHYRSKFLALVELYKGVALKSLRLVPDNGVSWLYRNDREWLVLNTPRMWQS